MQSEKEAASTALNPAHAKILEQLGGPKVVAELVTERCRLRRPRTSQSVSMWKQRGRIPWFYRQALASACEEMGIDVPPDFLDYKEARA